MLSSISTDGGFVPCKIEKGNRLLSKHVQVPRFYLYNTKSFKKNLDTTFCSQILYVTGKVLSSKQS